MHARVNTRYGLFLFELPEAAVRADGAAQRARSCRKVEGPGPEQRFHDRRRCRANTAMGARVFGMHWLVDEGLPGRGGPGRRQLLRPAVDRGPRPPVVVGVFGIIDGKLSIEGCEV